jgi:hypothetical protein
VSTIESSALDRGASGVHAYGEHCSRKQNSLEETS